MKKILMVSFRFPYPLTDGSKIRIYNIGKILSRRYKVDLLSVNEGRIEKEYIKELETIFNKVVVYTFSPVRFKINTLRGLLSGDSLQSYYYYFGKVQRWINSHYDEYNLIFCVHIRMTRYLRDIKKLKVIDFIDATSMNYKEAGKRVRGLWKYIYLMENKRLLSYEIKMLKEYNKAFITSSFDKKYLERSSEYINNNLIVIPNGVNENIFFRPRENKEKDELVFLGKMDYLPNEDAVIYFAKIVFPMLKKEREKLKFIIVGARPTKRVLRLGRIKGIEVTGFVEDPYKYLEVSKVFVAPIRFGAGIQNKILEAMALRKPVVTTSCGAEGINGKDGEHFLVADSPEDMAEKILDLLENEKKRRAIGERARALIEKEYTWDTIGKRFLGEIEELC